MTDRDDADDDRDADLASEDLDAFLLLLESRLRSDFASPDLARLIASQGTFAPGGSGRRGGGAAAPLTTLPSGAPSSPSKFLRLLRKVFRRAAKPIKLRSLMSVLGMESDDMVGRVGEKKNGGSLALQGVQQPHEDNELEGRKTDAIVWKLLQDAEADDEMWVRVVAGIIRSKMFQCNAANGRSGGETETEAEKQLGKITKGILDNTQTAMEGAEERRKEAKTYLADSGNGSGNNERVLETFQIGRDLCPAYVPVRYTLLPPAAITSILPEVDANTDFAANLDAAILTVDAEVERKRAAEEGKELPGQAPGGAGMAVNGANGVAGRGTGVAGRGTHGASRAAHPLGGRAPGAAGAGRMRGRFSNVGGRGTGRGTGRGAAVSGGGASLFRPSATVGRGAGRGGMAGRASWRAGGRFGVAGRAGSLSRLGAGRASSSAAASRAPLPRRAPGAARALLAASGRGAGGGGGGGEASKMKLIDASEAEGLSQRQRAREERAGMSAVEARKLERKRKLMEDAKASGLRNGREKRARPGAGAEINATGDNGANGPATDAAAAAGVPPNQSSAPTDVPGTAVPTSEGQQLDSLLEKSNKLSSDAYRNIHAFFHHRAVSNHRPQPPLPLPEGGDASTGVWKVKLNEEKTVDPTTGESVKETLYLELDYRSLGYKKTRKIKRK